MSTHNIDVSMIINSDTQFTECYAFGFATMVYDMETQDNIDTMREFVVNHKNDSANYSGIVKLTSNVTSLAYHSGKGDEEFVGVLPKVFENTESTDEDIIAGRDRNNLIHAIRHGINRSVWTINPITSIGDYWMVLFTHVTHAAPLGGGFHWQHNGTYLKRSSGGNVTFKGSDHVVVSSLRNETEDMDDGQTYQGLNFFMQAGRGGEWDSADAINDFFIFKVDQTSLITGFHLKHWTGHDPGTNTWVGSGTLTYEIRRVNHKNSIAEFDAAVLRPGNYVTTPNNTPTHEYSNLTNLLSQFDVVSSHSVTSSGIEIDHDFI